MLEMILDFFVDMIGDFLKVLIGILNSIMIFDLKTFTATFPHASTFYSMFQAIGIGIVMAIAIFNLFKFFAGPLTRSTERPTSVLVRAFFAIGLIYFGNYILSLVFEATAGIYNAFTDTITKTADGKIAIDALNNFGSRSTFEGEVGALAATVVVGDATIMLIMIIVCIALVIQIVKMLLEVLERFITLCLLIFSSPLAWATFTSESSSEILKKWLSMFFGQCVLMILSAWGVGMFVSVIQGPAGLITRLLYSFAMVKIIKRFDTYLQQVGLNAAGMGGGSLFDAVATAGSILGIGRGGKGGGGGSGGGILGKNLYSRLGQSSGLVQGILGAKGALKNVGNNGGFLKKAAAAASGFGKGMFGGTAVGGAIQRAVGVKKAGGSGADVTKSILRGRKDNPTTVDQAAQKQKATKSVAEHGKALKEAKTSRAKGAAAAGAMRSLASMPPEIAASPDVKALASSVGETLRNDPVAAFEAMDNIASQGGLELSGDAATAAWEGFVGPAAMSEAFGYDESDGAPNFTSQTLTIGTDENGAHTFEYSGTIEADDGAQTSIQWSNQNGELARQYQTATTNMANRERAELEKWKAGHEGATFKDGTWTATNGDKYTPRTDFTPSHIKKVNSQEVASVHNGERHTQATYVRRVSPMAPTKPPAKSATKPPANSPSQPPTKPKNPPKKP